MKNLDKNWITENIIDFEYKRYQLLAYLQGVEQEFKEEKLYPIFQELIEHYNSLVLLKNKKQHISEYFSKNISKIDFDKLKIEYESSEKSDPLIEELENIIEFSIPQFEKHLGNGKNLYTEIESVMTIEPIGLIPLNVNEGYMLVVDGKKCDTIVYQYNITLFEKANERYKGIHTSRVESFSCSVSNTFENIKQQLIKEKPEMPVPAVFAISSDKKFPLDESFFPIAKRSLVKFISTMSK